MSKIVKFLAHEGKVCVVCCDTTDLVENARKIHDLTPTTTAVTTTDSDTQVSSAKSNK